MTTPTQTPIHVTESGREGLRRYHIELAAYCRELPRLLAEGEEARFIVIQGDKILGTWDTYRDATQHGLAVCGDWTFMVHKITSRDQVLMKQVLQQEGYSLDTGGTADAASSGSASS